MKKEMTHWRKVDYRFESLYVTINGLDKSVKKLEKKIKDIHWYDGDWFKEESEPIIGLGFIAFQNYINSSIYDKYEKLNEQYIKYKIGKKLNNSGRTKIELIIALANYFKHRDSPKDLFKDTKQILTDFKLEFDKNVNIDNTPIIAGLELLTENWELKDIIKSVTNWREELWKDNE